MGNNLGTKESRKKKNPEPKLGETERGGKKTGGKTEKKREMGEMMVRLQKKVEKVQRGEQEG